jgi:hypothetical protein
VAKDYCDLTVPVNIAALTIAVIDDEAATFVPRE